MTELETLLRAKMYMEKLANGINPLDDTEIPAHEVVNHVRLSRCFFYVANVLGQVIDNGGPDSLRQNSPKQHRLPFDLRTVEREKVVLSDTPIPVSDLAKRISAGIDETGMRKLSFNSITKLLLSVGLLEEYPISEGRTAKRPTAQGRELGIFTEERMGQEGAYQSVLYNRNAQQFIVDNLDALQPFVRQPRENKGQPWTAEQDAQLEELWQKGISSDEIAREMGRSGMAIRARLSKRGLLK